MNAEGKYGEVRFQITDEKSQPVDGFTFDECAPLRDEDSLSWELKWKEARLEDVVGKVIRLEVTFRNARIYSLTAACHFLDAQDMWMLYDGKKIDSSMFDF